MFLLSSLRQVCAGHWRRIGEGYVIFDFVERRVNQNDLVCRRGPLKLCIHLNWYYECKLS